MKKFILVFALFISTILFSTIINVPADQPTIQEGITASTSGDTVLVAEGTYFENIDFIGKAITVASHFLIDADTLHIDNTIINGSQAVNPDYGSVVIFMSDEDTTSVLTGFTLTEGSGTYYQGYGTIGGGIMCISASPKIIFNIITNNSSNWSAGMSCDNSSPIIKNNLIAFNATSSNSCGGLELYQNSNAHVENNIISNNTSIDYNGGVSIQDSSPLLVNNIIEYNTANMNVGGIVLYGGAPILENTIIRNNHSESQCGGILVTENSTPTINNCYIYENTSIVNAGGVGISFNSVATISNSLIFGNQAGQYGGGIFIAGAGAFIDHTIVSGNSTMIDGGGIEIWNSTPIIINCTIYNNEAPGCGSQIDCWSGGLETINSIVAGNTPNGSIYFNAPTPTFDYCDFYNSDGLNFEGPSIPAGLGEIVNTNANDDPCDEFMNILLDPLCVDPANDDFHLIEDSPCIDAGDPTFPLDPFGTCVEIGRYCYDPTEIKENTIIHTTDCLSQNYPNPFNPETTINYQLTENCLVVVSVYNLRGQVVKTLVNKDLESGNHTVTWNGTDGTGKSVSSGIYFYKLKTTNFEQTKKMILMK